MKRPECRFEPEVLAAIRQSGWPERVDAALREHAASCGICADLVAVASAFEGAREELLAGAALPDAGRIWRLAQVRARREDIASAGRPITAAQVIAFGSALCLLGACFGATSKWFQATLARVVSSAAGFDYAATLSSATALLFEHGAFVLGMVAAILLVPTVFFVALGRD